MRLDRLLGDVEVRGTRGDPSDIDVTSVTHDSRAVTEGALFCCLRGARVDGHDFGADAVAAGAAALLCERLLPLPVAQVVVPATRPAMARVAAAFHGHPSRRATVVGVTGTNGKTTTAHLLGSVLEAAGRPVAVLGTLSGGHTTPESTELQARLAALVDAGITWVVMEVSSHALDQHRVDALWFSVAAFTNLSPDHLDYHGSMEEYFRAKASLFEPERARVGVVDADDDYGRLLLERAPIPMRPVSMADAEGLELRPQGAVFRWQGQPVHLRLRGSFNVANALVAAAAASELGVSPEQVAEGLSSVSSVPGRVEAVDGGQPFAVVVDYAHTPAALEELLVAARLAADGGRLIAVFGCGGDRDRAKRPVMGRLASELADLAVLTTDNPRSEDPAAIIEEVRSGVTRNERLAVEPDRRAAIALALGTARPGDVVVIAGKGHETVQVTAGQALPFDDRQVALEELERLSR